MRLKELWHSTGQIGSLQTKDDPQISKLIRDTRHVVPGSLFLCRQGKNFDSHQAIDQVFAQGANVCVVHNSMTHEKPLWRIQPEQEGLLASAFYGHPSRFLKILGVTGTDGKSTTSWLTAQMLQFAGHKVACLGTLGLWRGKQWEPWSLTTPEAEVLQEALANLLAEGFTHVVLEVSSHGLSRHRVQGIEFDAVALTNLGRDHLDDYPSLEEYHQAKEKLFALQPDPQKQVRPAVCAGQAFWKTGENISVKPLGLSEVKVSCRIHRWQGTCSLEGKHNLENLQTALGLAACVEEPQRFFEVIAQLKPPPGRWQWIEGSDKQVLVDYAHTPGALEVLLKNLRPLAANKLKVVFGCGGQRDRGKRTLMGQVADRLADEIWVTDDNPRQEDPSQIRRAVLEAIKTTPAFEVPDREQAIHDAIASLGTGDILAIAGKGHETHQVIGDQNYPFDDVQCASLAFQEVSHGC